MLKILYRSFCCALLLVFSLSGCFVGQAQPVEKTPLVVFAAGSLIIPFQHLEKAFEARYPNIDVLSEYHGSIQVIRHVTELHESIDVVATADASLIPMLMYTSTVPESGVPFSDWYIRFASNHLAIAYQPESLYANEINAGNWVEILSRPDVRVGIADPRFDASGYRAMMAIALEEERTSNYKLFGTMFNDQFTFPVTIFHDDDLTTITVPEVLETKPEAHIVIRGASIELIALLESGNLDYAFEYESVIHQHNLKMLPLHQQVNLGDPASEAFYSIVRVILDFQRFASIKPVFQGERIGYGVTIPSNSPHPKEAALFVAFLLSQEGRAIMESDSHPMFDTALADGYEKVPSELQPLVVTIENH